MTFLICAVVVLALFFLGAGRHVLLALVGAAAGSYFGVSGFGSAISGAIPGAVIGLVISAAVW